MAFNPKFAELLGSKLVSHGADKKVVEVDTIEALKDKKAIAIYFSAHWCPPCRGFTPQLAEWYTTSYKALGIEVVFASSDRDEAAFNDYFSEMPWLALPYAERDLKAKLAEKFECSGIPYLVILGADGTIVTKDGRSKVTEDKTGANFPWVEKPLSEIIGDSFEKKGEKLTLADFKGKKLGLYFSAHWCPPCRNFTPVLTAAYNKLIERGEKFEIVFCSSDQDEKAYSEYYATMPWASLPFADKDRKKALSDHFNVEGIPTLVILDEDMNLITDSAVGTVRADKDVKDFPWKAALVSDIDESCDGISDKPALVVIQDQVGTAEQEANNAVLTTIATEQAAEVEAEEAKNKDQKKTCFDADGAERFAFFSANTAGGRLRDRVANECRLKKDEKKTQIVLLAIHKKGGFYDWPADTAFTTKNAVKFMQDYRDGKLTRKQMGEEE